MSKALLLRFKAGSEAEKEVKKLIEERDKSKEKAIEIIHRHTGFKPAGLGYCWFFSISYSWNDRSTGFKKGEVPTEIPGMKFKEDRDYLSIYEPNRRTKIGRAISKEFQNRQCELRIDSEVMNKYGIYTCKELKYFDWIIGEDKNGIYFGIPSNAYSFLEPHPDVFLETEMQTVKA